MPLAPFRKRKASEGHRMMGAREFTYDPSDSAEGTAKAGHSAAALWQRPRRRPPGHAGPGVAALLAGGTISVPHLLRRLHGHGLVCGLGAGAPFSRAGLPPGYLLSPST